MTKLVALDSQETTELVGVAVAVICTGPPRVVTVGLEGDRLVEPKHALETQSWPTAQAFPQEPQLATSEVVSTHEVPQRSGVATGQVQTPERHDWASEGQTLPQVPQLATSVAVSTHEAPQRSGVATGQVQVPEAHVCASEGQTLPQVPQFCVSVARATHEEPQRSGVRAGQVQTPERQDWASEGHTEEHVPQFCVSVARLTHAAPQRSGVSKGQVQVPAVQDCAAAHVVVQLPQAVGSVWRNLQPWAQIVLPVGHAEVWLLVLSSWFSTVFFVVVGKKNRVKKQSKKRK